MLEQVLKSLVETTKDIEGAKVENNKFCVSVHYRNVDEKVISIILSQWDFLSLYLAQQWDHNKTNTSCLPLFTLHFCFQYWAVVAQRVHDILKNYPRLRLTHGRKV